MVCREAGIGALKVRGLGEEEAAGVMRAVEEGDGSVDNTDAVVYLVGKAGAKGVEGCEATRVAGLSARAALLEGEMKRRRERLTKLREVAAIISGGGDGSQQMMDL